MSFEKMRAGSWSAITASYDANTFTLSEEFPRIITATSFPVAVIGKCEIMRGSSGHLMFA